MRIFWQVSTWGNRRFEVINAKSNVKAGRGERYGYVLIKRRLDGMDKKGNSPPNRVIARMLLCSNPSSALELDDDG